MFGDSYPCVGEFCGVVVEELGCVGEQNLAVGANRVANLTLVAGEPSYNVEEFGCGGM